MTNRAGSERDQSESGPHALRLRRRPPTENERSLDGVPRVPVVGMGSVAYRA